MELLLHPYIPAIILLAAVTSYLTARHRAPVRARVNLSQPNSSLRSR